jgi:hypothetical protein
MELDAMIINKIQNFITMGKYIDLHQFINIAILNQIEEESVGNQPQSSIIHENSQIQQLVNKESLFNSNDNFDTDELPWIQILQRVTLEKSALQPSSSDLIWHFYTRFFPVKVIIHQLAKLMVMQQNNWIDLNEIQQKGFENAEKTSIILRDYENNKKLSRNKKLSTGLPTPPSELIGIHGVSKRRKEEKLYRGKKRFIEQIIGKEIPKNHNYFSGACFELGLMGIKFGNTATYVSLTELGKQFAILENPILDNERVNSSFSDDEVSFILSKIYPRFKLENKIVHKIVEWLKNEKLAANQLDQLFKAENRKDFVKERIATMGRLSELQIVNWEIDSQGKSQYSLNQERAHLIK